MIAKRIHRREIRRRDETEKRPNGRDVGYCLRAQGIFRRRACTGIKRRRMVRRERAKNNGMMRFGDVWSLKKDHGETRWFANFCISRYLCISLYNSMYLTSRNSQRFVRHRSSLRNLKTSLRNNVKQILELCLHLRRVRTIPN